MLDFIDKLNPSDKEKVYLRCKNCQHKEIMDKDLVVKIAGVAVTAFGFKAWVGFLFAGTGFAFPICAAIFAGGLAMLTYKDKIIAWLAERYECPECHAKNWELVPESTIKKEEAMAAMRAAYEERCRKLRMDFLSQQTEMEKLQSALDSLDSENKELRAQMLGKIEALYEKLAGSVNWFDHEKYEAYKVRYKARYAGFPEGIVDNIVTGILAKEYLKLSEVIEKSYEASMFFLLKSVEAIMFSIYEKPRFRTYKKKYGKSKYNNGQVNFKDICNIVELDEGHDWYEGFADELNIIRKARNLTMHKDLAKEADYPQIDAILFGTDKKTGMLDYLNQKLMELQKNA